MSDIGYECPECGWKHPDEGKFCPECWNCLNCLVDVGHVDPETSEPVKEHGPSFVTAERINIERLREAMHWLPVYAVPLSERDDMLLAPLGDVEAAIRFLLDLADEGGELVLFKPCGNGQMVCGDSDCDGGSRVRVWPPKEDES